MKGSLFDDPPEAPGRGGEWFTAHCDGGSRGNPGPAGYGAVIEDPQGRVVARLSEYLGRQTVNFAEYSGLIGVLKWAASAGVRRLRVISDSELMVRQMTGRYRVKHPSLLPLWDEARRLSRNFEAFEITHTLRGGNSEADRLANEAMDRGMGKPGDREQGTGSRRQETGNREKKPGSAQVPKPGRTILEGYVKDGVVHLLEGELPDGVFVKVIHE